jgi:hypothetical protein
MEGIMKSWILGALTVFVLPLTPVRLLADVGVDKWVLSTRDIYEEADPEYEEACFSMGRITIDYASGETGLPKVGFRITDPRGREIGYDPRTNRGWQEMPLAQAFLECEENEETGELKQCKDHVEICGPVSGTYQIEVLPTHSGKYSINVSATSERTRTEFGSDTTSSCADLNSDMHEQEPAELLLHYSREPGTQVQLTVSNQRLADRNKHHNRDSARVNRPSKGDISAHR